MQNVKLLAYAIINRAIKDAKNKKVSKYIKNDAIKFLNSEYAKDLIDFVMNSN